MWWVSRPCNRHPLHDGRRAAELGLQRIQAKHRVNSSCYVLHAQTLSLACCWPSQCKQGWAGYTPACHTYSLSLVRPFFFMRLSRLVWERPSPKMTRSAQNGSVARRYTSLLPAGALASSRRLYVSTSWPSFCVSTAAAPRTLCHCADCIRSDINCRRQAPTKANHSQKPMQACLIEASPC